MGQPALHVEHQALLRPTPRRAQRWAAWALAQLSLRMRAPTTPRSPDARAYARAQYARAGRFVELLRPFVPSPCTRVVDLGCGEGGETRYYARTLGDGGGLDVIGADINLAKLRAPLDGDSGRARFVCCDITALPLPDGCADLVITRDGFEHFMHPAAVLDETNRILRPGGRLVVAFAPYFGSKGPHLGGFVPVPYAHVVFSVPTIANAAQLVADHALEGLERAQRDALHARLQRCLRQALSGVNHITLRRWERLLLDSEGWAPLAYRKYSGRRLHRPLLLVPALQELVASVFAVLEKRVGGRIERRELQAAQRVALPQVINT